ncbi:hypothetical protein STEG23_037510 [Scotinomys teguina]
MGAVLWNLDGNGMRGSSVLVLDSFSIHCSRQQQVVAADGAAQAAPAAPAAAGYNLRIVLGSEIFYLGMMNYISLIISLRLFLLGDFASSCSRAFSFNLVDLSIGWNPPSSAFCRAGFVDRYCLNLVLSWNVLFTPSMVGKIFFNDFVEYVFCAYELVFFSFFYPYYSKGDWLLLSPRK